MIERQTLVRYIKCIAEIPIINVLNTAIGMWMSINLYNAQHVRNRDIIATFWPESLCDEFICILGILYIFDKRWRCCRSIDNFTVYYSYFACNFTADYAYIYMQFHCIWYIYFTPTISMHLYNIANWCKWILCHYNITWFLHSFLLVNSQLYIPCISTFFTTISAVYS